MAKSKYFGFNPPFYKPGSILPTQTDERLIKNDVLQLLMTIPGEREFRPEFGTDLRTFVFEQIDKFSVDSLKRSILSSIDKNEPRIQVDDLIIERKDDDNMIVVKLYAHLTIDKNRILELNISLPTSGQNIRSPQSG